MLSITNKNTIKKIGIVLFSGGQDSTTVLAYAKKLGYKIYALSIIYGQTLKNEIEKSKQICRLLNVKQLIFDFSSFKDIGWYSALTNPEKFKIPKYKKHVEIGSIIPFTYVPIRNVLFVIIAASYLESIILNIIENEKTNPEEIEASIFIGVNNIDFSNYPDCRPETFKHLEKLLKVSSKIGSHYNIKIKIKKPLIHMSKKEITDFGIKLEVPFHLTQTCYIGKDKACGNCPSCLLRIKGFQEAGYVDPIEYENAINWTNCKPIKNNWLK